MQSDKNTLRKQLREKRRALTAEQQAAAASGLAEQITALRDYQAAKSIAMYLANDGEIDPKQVLDQALQDNKACYLPIVLEQNGKRFLRFAPLTERSVLQKNRLGILEPVAPEADYIDVEQLDLLLMPLVGFDQQGSRIGMGGGFYDTTLEYKQQTPDANPQLIGLAHECQRVERIDAESWDIPLIRVVTDQRVYQLS